MYYILLKSCQALLCGRFNIHALPGTIVDTGDNGKGLSLDQKDLQVFFNQQDVRELSEDECSLLVAIPQPRQRLLVIEDEEWMKEGLTDIEVGSKVTLSKWSSNKSAIVRYKGCIPERGKGVYFGVELSVSSILTPSDGTYRDRRLFQCEAGHGDFATLSEIRLDKGKPPVPPKPKELPPVKRRARNRVLKRPSSLPPLTFFPENSSPRPYSNPERTEPIVTSTPKLFRKTSLPDYNPSEEEHLSEGSTIKQDPQEEKAHPSNNSPGKPPASTKEEIDATIISQNFVERSKISVFHNQTLKLEHSAQNGLERNSAKKKANETHNVYAIIQICEKRTPGPKTDVKKQEDKRHAESLLNDKALESPKSQIPMESSVYVKPQPRRSLGKAKDFESSVDCEPFLQCTQVKEGNQEKSDNGFFEDYLSMDSPSRKLSKTPSFQQKEETRVAKKEVSVEHSSNEMIPRVPSPIKTNTSFEDLSDAVKTYISDMITDVLGQHLLDDKSDVSQVLTQKQSHNVDNVAAPKNNSIWHQEVDHLTRISELEMRVIKLESQLKLFEGFCGKYNTLEIYLREQRRAQEALEQKVKLLENANKRREAIDTLYDRRVLSPTNSVSSVKMSKVSSPLATDQKSSCSLDTTPTSEPNGAQEIVLKGNENTSRRRLMFASNEYVSENEVVGMPIRDDLLVNEGAQSVETDFLDRTFHKQTQNQVKLDQSQKENKMNDSLVEESARTDFKMKSQRKNSFENCPEEVVITTKEHDKLFPETEGKRGVQEAWKLDGKTTTQAEKDPHPKPKLRAVKTESSSIGLENLNVDEVGMVKAESVSEEQQNNRGSPKKKKYTGENFKVKMKKGDEPKPGNQIEKVTMSQQSLHDQRRVDESGGGFITDGIEIEKSASIEETAVIDVERQTEITKKSRELQNKENVINQQGKSLMDTSVDEEDRPTKDLRRRVSPKPRNSYYEHWKLSNYHQESKVPVKKPGVLDSLTRPKPVERMKTNQIVPDSRTRVSIVGKTQVSKSRKTSAQERMDFLMESLKEHSQNIVLADVLEQQVK